MGMTMARSSRWCNMTVDRLGRGHDNGEAGA